MNSGYIGPRKVAPRAPLRWAKQALAMILREPLLVTAALVLFLLLDHGFLVLTSGQEFALRITLQLISPAFLTTFLVLLRRLDTGVFQEIDLRGALWMALRWGGGPGRDSLGTDHHRPNRWTPNRTYSRQGPGSCLYRELARPAVVVCLHANACTRPNSPCLANISRRTRDGWWAYAPGARPKPSSARRVFTRRDRDRRNRG